MYLVAAELLHADVRNTNRTHLALAFEVDQAAHRLLDRCQPRFDRWLMHLQQVDGLNVESFKASLNLQPHSFGLQADVGISAILVTVERASLICPPDTAFGRYYNLLASTTNRPT